MAKKPQPSYSFQELVGLMRDRYPGMSPQFQVGARHLIDHPDQVPVQSMRSIAAEAGVQPATLVRLVKSLGYQGWEELRQVFIRGLQQQPKPYAEQARNVVRRRNSRNALHRHMAAHIANLQFLEAQNGEALAEAVKILQRARHVHVAGFRASYAAAYTLHYLYRLFRNSVSLLRGDVGLLEMELRALEPGDAVVIIGFAPYSREGLRVAEAASERGCRIVALCDSKLAPLARHAETTLLFSTETAGFFPSSAAALALVETLASQLLGKAGQYAIQALGQAEEQLHRSGAYVQPEAATSGRE